MAGMDVAMSIFSRFESNFPDALTKRQIALIVVLPFELRRQRPPLWRAFSCAVE